MLRISAMKTKISVKIILMITVKNTGMQNVSYCQITTIKNESKDMQFFSQNFCKVCIKNFFWMLDVEKLRTITLNMATILNLFYEREI